MTRVGLVGCGRWGAIILRDLIDLGADVTVVDPSGAGGGLTDLDHLPEVDGIVVATPATTHADVVEAVLKRGVPVFCEKPFTTDVGRARSLVEHADGLVHVMHVWRYHPGIECLGELSRSGLLGRVHGVSTRRVNGPSPRVDTDPVWTLVPHDLSIAVEILGHIPEPRAAVADVVDGRPLGLWGYCGQDPWLVIEASTRHREKRREVRVHGEEAMAVLSGDGAETVQVERPGGATEHQFTPGQPLRLELESFLGHLAGGPPPKSDAAEGLAVVEAVQGLRDLAGL